MANSVEGRFPFLDYRLVELANRLPSRMKLRGLRDKHILRLATRDWLPDEIRQRPKRPYRAPVHRSFFGGRKLEYVEELLSEHVVAQTGLFEAKAVAQLVKRIQGGTTLGETDEMAVAGIISTQLLHHQFVNVFKAADPISEKDDVKLCRRGFAVAG